MDLPNFAAPVRLKSPTYDNMTRSIVEFQNVSKIYRTGLLGRRTIHALRGVSFNIPRGSVFGLIGPS